MDELPQFINVFQCTHKGKPHPAETSGARNNQRAKLNSHNSVECLAVGKCLARKSSH